MKLIKYILITILMTAAVGVRAEQWRQHATYDGNLESIIDTPNYTYLLSYNQGYYAGTSDNDAITLSLFRYDKEGEELLHLNRQNKLSANILQTAAYNYDKKYLVIVYDDGNIDLLYDDGSVTNVPGLKLAGSDYSKNVNSISFDATNNLVYLATDFGYFTIDDKKGEIGVSRNFGSVIKAAAYYDGKVFLGTSSGVLCGESRATSLTNFATVPGILDVKKFLPLGDRLYIFDELDWKSRVDYVSKESWGYSINQFIPSDVKSLDYCKDGIMASCSTYNRIITTGGTTKDYTKDTSDVGSTAASYDGKTYYVDRERSGLQIKEMQNDGAKWVIKSEKLLPNAANAFKSTGLQYSSKYGMLVRNHGYSNDFTTLGKTTPDLISGLKNLEWTSYSQTYRRPTADALTVWNPNGLAIDPNNSDQVYCGSVLNGLLRLDLSDISKSLRIATTADEYASSSNVAAVVPVMNKWTDMCSFGVPSFDSNGYLWVPFYNLDNDANEKGVEIWYWSPEDRAASTTASNYKAMKKWVLSGVSGNNLGRVMALKSSANKNMILYWTESGVKSMIFIDHQGTPDTRSDDVTYQLSSDYIYDQDGTQLTHGHNAAVYEDTSTGNIWVGCDDGVYYFNPKNLSKNSSSVYRVKVARNDGTQLVDFLLNGVKVTSITQDGKGRKWFGTLGAGVVCTSSNGQEVIKSYTSDDSILPDDDVYGLCYNPENNSMMISTGSGLAELYLSSTDATDEESGIVAYPNPVRPTYFGYVTIDGLEDGAIVKIADSAGNMIKELGYAQGGTIQWDVTNFNHKRVRSGVYYVLASAGPDGESYNAVTKILVVN